jgi:hypothetical protein
MDETYRMLGREHEADLEREARKWQLAAQATRSKTPNRERSATKRTKGIRLIPLLVVAAAAALAIAALATLVSAAAASTVAAPTMESRHEPQILAQARVIRAEVNARYRLMPGRKLAVTEATTTSVVESLTLITDLFKAPRVVPADNGIYFALCPARATCPYPARSASWPALAFLPRRQALELAIRTFLETSASLVVVALPTAKPIWLVFTRDDLLAQLDAPALRDRLAVRSELLDTTLLQAVDRLTRPRLFIPVAIVTVASGRETFEAIGLFAP